MKTKGINVHQPKSFVDEKKFIIKMWSEIFDKVGETKVKNQFKEVFSQKTFAKFPEILTKKNIKETILSLSEDELKCK